MTIAQPIVVEALLAEAAQCGFDQSCTPETGALLRTLAASKPKGRLLNLGTGFGVSSAWILDGMSDDAELWTVDIDDVGSAVRVEVADQHVMPGHVRRPTSRNDVDMPADISRLQNDPRPAARSANDVGLAVPIEVAQTHVVPGHVG